MNGTRLLPAILVLLHSAVAVAQPTPRLTVIGIGAGIKCGEWAAGARWEEAVEQWALGFASGIAAGVQISEGSDPLASLDREAIHTWLNAFCAERPESTMTLALARMVITNSRSRD